MKGTVGLSDHGEQSDDGERNSRRGRLPIDPVRDPRNCDQHASRQLRIHSGSLQRKEDRVTGGNVKLEKEEGEDALEVELHAKTGVFSGGGLGSAGSVDIGADEEVGKDVGGLGMNDEGLNVPGVDDVLGGVGVGCEVDLALLNVHGIAKEVEIAGENEGETAVVDDLPVGEYFDEEVGLVDVVVGALALVLKEGVGAPEGLVPGQIEDVHGSVSLRGAEGEARIPPLLLQSQLHLELHVLVAHFGKGAEEDGRVNKDGPRSVSTRAGWPNCRFVAVQHFPSHHLETDSVLPGRLVAALRHPCLLCPRATIHSVEVEFLNHSVIGLSGIFCA